MNEELINERIDTIRKDLTDVSVTLKEHIEKNGIFERDLQKEMLDMRQETTQIHATIANVLQSVDRVTKSLEKGKSDWKYVLTTVITIATIIIVNFLVK